MKSLPIFGPKTSHSKTYQSQFQDFQLIKLQGIRKIPYVDFSYNLKNFILSNLGPKTPGQDSFSKISAQRLCIIYLHRYVFYCMPRRDVYASTWRNKHV